MQFLDGNYAVTHLPHYNKMAIASEQLKEIFNELHSSFENDRYITVIPFDDELSEKYEINYNILGLSQDSAGNVFETREHSILISIPFGFPHFPPSCKPQSETFHPDFDLAAICIGDFWNKDKTLSELIIHIGQMISGEVYSTENGFNENAVSWYTKNSKKLPFEILSFGPELEYFDDQEELEEDAEEELEENSEEEFDEESATRFVDILDDTDLSADSDYLSLEKDETTEEIAFPPSTQPSGKGPLDKILQLIRQKRYHQVSSLLASFPEEEEFEDRDEIVSQVEDILNKARKMQQRADELEHQGDAADALQQLEKILEIVPDFPNINENIERTQKTCELSEGWTPDTDQDPDDSDIPEGLQSKKRVAFYGKKKKGTLKIVPVLAVAIPLILVIAIGYQLLTAGSRLKEIEQNLVQCKKLLSQDEFTHAKKTCDSALSSLSGVVLFKKKERLALTTKIQQTISSEKMQQGLTGRIKFHGKFVKKSDMEMVQNFVKAKDEGDTLYSESAWTEASEKYLLALQITRPNPDNFETTTIKEVKEKYTIAQINILIEKGEQLLADGKLDKSDEIFTKATGTAKKLPEETRNIYLSKIGPKLSEIEYLQLLDLGRTYFDSNDWENAIEQYEKALKLQDQTSLAQKQEEMESLHANMAEAELYSLISSGKEALSNSHWDKAISLYKEALALLDVKEERLKRINPPSVKFQLQRTILRARIVQSKQDADIKLENDLYKDAIESFNEVITLITESNLQKDQEFRSIYTGANASIVEARKNATIADRIAYLIKDYKQIFQDNYAAAVPQYMKKPRATFEKSIGRKQVYKLECLESGQGRKLKLVMFYMYDPDTKKWQFYNDN